MAFILIRSEIRTRHGAGYTVFEHNSNGLLQELTVFVPVNDAGGDPVKIQRLRLTNTQSRRRQLTVTYYVELVLGRIALRTSLQHLRTFAGLYNGISSGGARERRPIYPRRPLDGHGLGPDR